MLQAAKPTSLVVPILRLMEVTRRESRLTRFPSNVFVTLVRIHPYGRRAVKPPVHRGLGGLEPGTHRFRLELLLGIDIMGRDYRFSELSCTLLPPVIRCHVLSQVLLLLLTINIARLCSVLDGG